MEMKQNDLIVQEKISSNSASIFAKLNTFFLILRQGLILTLFLTVITGLIYPLMVTWIGAWLFPVQVAGNLITLNHQIVGSSLIGQYFTDPQYFWGRPSTTAFFPYNAMASGGSNLGPLNPQLKRLIGLRVAKLNEYPPSNSMLSSIPVDLVTASGSGLDPDISIAAAFYQIQRIAYFRHLSVEKLVKLIKLNTQGRQLWILGEPSVNVLQLNLALDALKPNHP